LPIRWVSIIAPYNADIWEHALAPLHERGPAWAPLTLDPIGTRIEILKGVTYCLALMATIKIARSREGLRFVAGTVVVSGLVLAAAALLHPAFGAHKLFGFYQPEVLNERHLAPLMNPNNLASYLNISLCLALASALSPSPYPPRAIMAAVVLLLGASQIWIASRGGVVAMGLGVIIVFAIQRLARSRPQGAVAALSLVTAAATALGTVLIVLAGSEAAKTELLDTDVSKIKIFYQAMKMFPSVPLFGCGRGAFASVFPAFRTSVGYAVWMYPENVVAQWVLEWGMPVAVAGLIAITLALQPSAVLARSSTASGAWAAVVAVTVQNFGDLGTEIPGLVLAGVVCASIVVAGTPGDRPRWRAEAWAQVPRRVAIWASASAGAAIAVAALGIGGELRQDERALYDAAVEHWPLRTTYAFARGAMLRHPAEPYLPFMAAVSASHVIDENPLPWLGATFERARVYGPAHLVLANVLARRAPPQARLEYRMAMEQMPEEVSEVLADLPSVIRGYDDAIEVVPEDKVGTTVLEWLAKALKARLPATSVRLDADLAARTGSVSGTAAVRAALDATEDLEAGTAAPWCESSGRGSCVQKALERAVAVQRDAPDRCEGYLLGARARVASDDASGAAKELEDAIEVVVDRVPCLQKLEGVAYTLGDDSKAEEALDRVANAGCVDDEECAHNLAWAAQREEARGNSRKALALYKRAFERAPQDDSILEAMAVLAEDVGLHTESADEYLILQHRHPSDERWKAGTEREREAAAKAAFGL
jgi:hypothetical protein